MEKKFRIFAFGLLGVLLLSTIAIIGGLVVWFRPGMRTMDADIKAIGKMGYPTAYGDIKKFAPQTGSDAMDDYERFALRIEGMNAKQKEATDVLISEDSPKTLEARKKAAALLLPLFQPLKDGAKKDRWGILALYRDGDPLFPSRTRKRMNNAVEGARTYGRIALVDAETGKGDAAVEKLLTLMKFSKHIGQSPILDDQYGAMSVEIREQLVCRRLLILGRDDVTGVKEVQACLDKLPPLPNLRNAMITYFLSEAQNMKHPTSRMIGAVPPEDFPEYTFTYKPKENRLIDQCFARWRAIFEKLPKDPEDYEGMRRACLEATNRFPMPALGTGFEDADFLPDFARDCDIWMAILARRRTLRTAVRVVQYRQAHKIWPKSLDGLDKDAIDPFSGKRLHYMLWKKGFKIYSVGPDRKDNGGAPRKGDSKIGDVAYTF